MAKNGYKEKNKRIGIDGEPRLISSFASTEKSSAKAKKKSNLTEEKSTKPTSSRSRKDGKSAAKNASKTTRATKSTATKSTGTKSAKEKSKSAAKEKIKGAKVERESRNKTQSRPEAANDLPPAEKIFDSPTVDEIYSKPSKLTQKAKAGAKIRVIPLGGLNEVGKNMTVVEYEDDIIVIDCGLGFPDEETLGVDLVIPDVSYLEANADKIRGIVLTHGHEDHIGAIPYVLRKINPPIYGTKLTLGIVRNKLKEFSLDIEPRLVCVNAGDTIRLGQMSVEFIHVNHSIADACALAIRTPLGTLVHSGDFKLDLTPIDSEVMDITRLGEIGREGVLLLMCESTNAERAGITPSERKVGASLEYIFTVNKEKRIVIATFSSNVHRVQQIIDTAARHGRKVAITGRSMLNIVGAAVELGYMNVPDNVLIDIAEIKRYKPEEITLVTTGSQGEPMSALYRMAFGEHREVSLGAGDLVVLSSSAIPGNEKLVGRIVNELCKLGVKVIHDAAVEVHVSGHACQEELKLMQALTKPKYFMPVHGEYKHMAANRELALYMGTEPQNIFISDIGKVLEIDAKGARWGGTVTAGRVFVDGYGVGDVGNIVLRDRRLLSQDGLIVVVAAVSSDGFIVSGPDIVSRGFVYVRESEDLVDELKDVARQSMAECLNSRKQTDWFQIKSHVKDDMAKFILAKTKRKPMIIPMIMEV